MKVAELWRYPVKSMQGERLEVAEVTPFGLAGDRSWAVVDDHTGLALTARRQPELLFAAARLQPGGEVQVTLPTGAVTSSDDELSDWLGHDVHLERAAAGRQGTYEIALSLDDEDNAEWVTWNGPEGSFHDSTRARVSLVSKPTMREWDPRRFRFNIVLDGGDEDALLDQSIRVGSVAMDVVKLIDRCVMTTRPQPGGIERDLTVLKTINAERQGYLGIGALVAGPGTIRVGDEVAARPDDRA